MGKSDPVSVKSLRCLKKGKSTARQARRAAAKARLDAPALTPPAPTAASNPTVRVGLAKALAPD
jgi:hypothetical protein